MANVSKTLTRTSVLVAAFIKMTESAFTHDVLIPLLENLGYSKVEYHGGPNEGGKDIICWGTDEIGDTRVAVAQVKKDRLSATAGDSKGFATIVTQLSQALEKRIPGLDGLEYYPSAVYLITPYSVTTRAVESRFEGYQALRSRNVRIMDGAKVAELLCAKLPNLASSVLGSRAELHLSTSEHLSNDVLMSALGYTQPRDLKQIYTDIDFTLGRATTRMFFGSTYKGRRMRCAVSVGEWSTLKGAAIAALEQLDLDISPGQTVETLDKEFQREWRRYQKFSNTKHEVDEMYKAAEQELSATLRTLEGLCGSRSLEQGPIALRRSFKRDIDKATRSLATVRTWTESTGREISARARTLLDGLGDIFKGLRYRLTDEGHVEALFLREFDKTVDKARACVGSYERAQRAHAKLPKEAEIPGRTIDIDGTRLADALRQKRADIEDQLAVLRNAVPCSTDLAKMLDHCRAAFVCANAILASEHVCAAVGIPADQTISLDREAYRLSCPLKHIFDTGRNVAILGEAGSGKSTALQVYATSLLENRAELLTMFAPLASMMNAWRRTADFAGSETPELVEGIAVFFATYGAAVTGAELDYLLANEDSVLLLDGIDEVVGSFPWIIDAMSSYAKRFPRSQLITSSRMSGSYVEEIPFFCVTLLPFTDTQRSQFIRNWFHEKGGEHVSSLLDHLEKHAGLREVTTNPLLATVLCTLEERNAQLPDSEVALYEERFRLLLGDYDIRKDVRRTTTRRHLLEFLCRKLAFDLHREERREERREWFYDRAEVHLRTKPEYVKPEKAVDELVDPCNILVIMNDWGELGFGHLRYQEFLAAKELSVNRFVPFEKYVSEAWWKGVVELFALQSDDLWRVMQVVDKAPFSDAVLETVKTMLEAMPSQEASVLRAMVARLELESQLRAKGIRVTDMAGWPT